MALDKFNINAVIVDTENKTAAVMTLNDLMSMYRIKEAEDVSEALDLINFEAYKLDHIREVFLSADDAIKSLAKELNKHSAGSDYFERIAETIADTARLLK